MRSLQGFAAFSLRRIAIGLIAALGVAAASTAQAQTAPTVPQPEREWTFLVYLNGHNNLDPFGLTNIRDMEKVGSTERVNVVVQWASLSNAKTKRLFVQKQTGSPTGPLASTVIEELPPVDMGDYHSLIEFVRWGVQNFPAKKYFINIWNHGGGWHLSQMALAGVDFSPTDISWDDKTGHSIKTEELGVAMAEIKGIIGHNVDIYGSDACLMAMAEVASEMSGSVDAFLGSQEVEPGAGWPYDAVLRAWNSMADASPLEVSKAFAHEYVQSYSGGSNGDADVTMSVYDMTKLPAFESAARNFAAALARSSRPLLQKALRIASNAQSFDYNDYVDIVDFATALSRDGDFRAMAEIAEVNTAASALTYFNETTSEYANAHGISVWIPAQRYLLRQYLTRYQGLKFDKATGWSSFLQAMFP